MESTSRAFHHFGVISTEGRDLVSHVNDMISPFTRNDMNVSVFVKRSTRRIYRVERKDIAYLRFMLESYDGMAVVSTLDPSEARIEMMISPGCEGLVEEILCSLQEEDGIRVVRLSRGTEGVDEEVR